jgi:uncharacterized protein (DUF2252 family)
VSGGSTYLSLSDRVAKGRAVRAQVPRSVHGRWQPPAARRDPAGMPERQAASAFRFFRGGAYAMAAHLAASPRTSLWTQLCGDAHFSNFGAFAAPGRRRVFDLDDLDETLPGPFEWDLKRLVASFAVAGRERDFGDVQRLRVSIAAARSYRDAMWRLARMGTIDAWYSRLDGDDVAHAADRNAGTKLVYPVGGEPRISSDPPRITPIEQLTGDDPDAVAQMLSGSIQRYGSTLPSHRRHLLDRLRYAHAARRGMGGGSADTVAWIVLMLGRDAGDPVLLQLKPAGASVLEPFLGTSHYPSHGQRVVEGQRRMQAVGNVLLGWDRITTPDGITHDVYIRQLWDQHGSIDVQTIAPGLMLHHADLCGQALARAHARAGDAAAIAGYIGLGDALPRALAVFAEAYADQNQRDHEALRAAGRLQRLANGQRPGDVGERQYPDQAAMLEHQAAADGVGR